MKSFLSNLNARLLAIHFIAFWLVMYAFQEAAFLRDYKFMYLDHVGRINAPFRFDADMALVEQAGNIGLILAFILSWVISVRKNWHWINSVIVFVATFAIENWGLLHWKKFHDIYLSPGGLFKAYSVWAHVLVAVLLLAAAGLLIYSKPIVRFISGKANDKKAALKGGKKAKAKVAVKAK
jgi:hypothetical protein